MINVKYIVLRDRKAMLTPTIWNAEVQTSLKVKNFYGQSLTSTWIIFKQGRQISVYLKKEFEQVGKYIAARMFKYKVYFAKIEKRVIEDKNKIEKFLIEINKVDFSKQAFEQLLGQAELIKELWIKFDLANVYAWFIGGDQYKQILEKKLKLSENDFLTLATPLEKTYASQFENEYLKCLNKIRKNKSDLEKYAEWLANKYGWLPFNYDGPEYWDKKYFIAKLKRDLISGGKKFIGKDYFEKNKKKRDALMKKHSLENYAWRIEIIRKFTYWTDERKRLDYQLNFHYARILREIGKRYNFKYINLKYLFVDELPLITNSRQTILKISNDRIDRLFIVKYRNKRREIILGEKAEKFLKELEQKKDIKLRGLAASRGSKAIYRGKVKILNSSKDGAKVKTGDFLVTSMTTPDYILAMKKAIGFITDEGGVTCHAAITAREMNKPAIIGTKIATKVLKDGDLVEVDINKGIIKIIK